MKITEEGTADREKQVAGAHRVVTIELHASQIQAGKSGETTATGAHNVPAARCNEMWPVSSSSLPEAGVCHVSD